MLVAPNPGCCFAKLAAWALTAEDRDQLACVGFPTLRASRCLLLQVIVLRHGSLDLETLAARRTLEFIDGHHSTSGTPTPWTGDRDELPACPSQSAGQVTNG